jgi:hypothetical protein
VAWVLHNYHVSRSAGPIAARFAVGGSPAAARFQRDAIDEYWHCDSFYFVEGCAIGLPAADAKAAVPLAGSIAFEDLARRTAEEDPLGHVLIALFQEASIAFKSNAESFYDAVEYHYDLPGFFAGWRRHMRLDEDQGHADGVAAALTDFGPVSPVAFERAMRRVQLAQFYLSAALGQAGGYLEAEAALRRPSDVDRPIPGNGPRELSRGEADYLFCALRDGSLAGLAQAREHDHIMQAGRLCGALQALSSATIQAPNPWLLACRNFILERAGHLAVLPLLAAEVCRVAPDLELSAATLGALERSAELNGGWCCGADDISAAQLRELLHLALEAKHLDAIRIFAEPEEPDA